MPDSDDVEIRVYRRVRGRCVGKLLTEAVSNKKVSNQRRPIRYSMMLNDYLFLAFTALLDSSPAILPAKGTGTQDSSSDQCPRGGFWDSNKPGKARELGNASVEEQGLVASCWVDSEEITI